MPYYFGHLLLLLLLLPLTQLNHTLTQSMSLLSSVFCCRAGSGYPNTVLGNSRGGFPLPSSWFVITYCDQSFPSPWHCLSVAPSLSCPGPLSRVFHCPQPGDAGGRHSTIVPQPSANLSHQQTLPHSVILSQCCSKNTVFICRLLTTTISTLSASPTCFAAHTDSVPVQHHHLPARLQSVKYSTKMTQVTLLWR